MVKKQFAPDTQSSTVFMNRILKYDVKAADQFTANPLNPRLHPQFQRDVMKEALEGIGWLAPVIENQRTGYLIDGHERVMQALERNELVPYVLVDLSEDEEAEALATFDPIGGLAQYDPEILNQLLQDLEPAGASLQQMLTRLATENDALPLNDQWPEFDETVINHVKYCTCPKCGHQFPK